MKFIIMCGGNYHMDTPKHLLPVKGEPIVARTIRLLRDCGVSDIAISATDDRFEDFGVPVLRHHNKYGDGGMWLDAFYPVNKAVCYIFGDVVFSPDAILTIVETETDCIQFFASSPPFADNYTKNWAEPFAFKVKDTKYFRECVDVAKQYAALGRFKRHPVSWELWQVIMGTPLNDIDYTNYCTINDYTCDVDYPDDIEKIERLIP